MVDRSPLPGSVLLLADRNYESYNNMAHLEEKGWKYYFIRVKDGKKGSVSGLVIPERPEFDYTVGLLHFHAKKARQTLPLWTASLPSLFCT